MKFLPILMSITIFMCLPATAYASWEAYKDVGDINVEGDFKVGYIDIDGDFAKEIIIESKHGAGSNHYLEMMRIFKEKGGQDWELDLIFSIWTLDSTFGFVGEMKQYNCDIVSEVEFTEAIAENKEIRNIIVKSRKIYYKDDENKVMDREEELETKVYKWNGTKFEEEREL